MIKLWIDVFGDELCQQLIDVRDGFRRLDDCGTPGCNRAHLPPSRKGLARRCARTRERRETYQGPQSQEQGHVEGGDDEDDALGLRFHRGTHREEAEVEVDGLLPRPLLDVIVCDPHILVGRAKVEPSEQ